VHCSGKRVSHVNSCPKISGDPKNKFFFFLQKSGICPFPDPRPEV
jgi:hypothetical protein